MLSKTVSPSFLRLLACGLTGMLFLYILSRAWVADDAYITFRVVDNIVNGFGAVWNPGMRVQVYTHPLWMLLHIPLYAAFGHIYLITIILSFICFAAAFAYGVRTLDIPLAESIIAIAVPILFSIPVTDYAICGLENPLSMLLIAAFIFYLRPYPNYTKLGIISALMVLNRIDLGLICAPFWLLQCSVLRHRFPIKKLIPGTLLLTTWFTFSLWYYGFLLPNTKPAKLNAGIPSNEIGLQGFYYLLDLSVRDILSTFLIFFTLYLYLRSDIKSQYSKNMQMIALGTFFYAGYIIAVGGDFMGGRFWAVPIFICILLLPHKLPAYFFTKPSQLIAWLILLTVGFFCANAYCQSIWSSCATLSSPYNPAPNKAVAMCSLQGIIDERGFYNSNTTFFPIDSWHPRLEVEGYWVELGLALKAQHATEPQDIGASGMEAFFAGPDIIFVDHFALSDPLLARLPMQSGPWRIGHLQRAIPKGYLHAMETKDRSEMEQDLATYDAALTEIISAPLWSASRLKTIWNFNTGHYDNLRDSYIARHCAEFYQGCH